MRQMGFPRKFNHVYSLAELRVFRLSILLETATFLGNASVPMSLIVLGRLDQHC